MENAEVTPHRVVGGADLGLGTTRLLEIGERRICLARTEEGEIFAVDDTCTHEEQSLSEGWLEDGCIECPAHNATFDLRTGEAVTLPAVVPVRTYPVARDGDDLVVDLPGD